MAQPLGIIAGSGIEKLFEVKETKEVTTPYGAPSEKIDICDFNGNEICFLRRHGKGHVIQPHKVNYRANIWALKELGVKKILSISAVGSLKEELHPGMLVFPNQFIDHT